MASGVPTNQQRRIVDCILVIPHADGPLAWRIYSLGVATLGRGGLEGVNLPPGRRNPRKGRLKGGKLTPWTPQPSERQA